MFYSEKEIHRVSEDRLNRNDFAYKLSKNICDYENDDSLTIGVVGSWGSGKSSLINLILEKIEWRWDIIIIRFNPWMFSDQKNLYYQFFKLLISTFKNREIEDENIFDRKTNPQWEIFKKSEIETLKDYFNYIDKSRDEFNMDDLALSSQILQSYESLETLKGKCNEYFEKLGCKIIVVIDDIDRLIDEEIKQVFTLVKSLADFKKFIYILSFDTVVVAKALNKYHSDYEYKFLEKIVQIPIRVPDVTSSKIEQLIIEDIKPIYDRYSIDSYINEDDDFYQIMDYLKMFIRNIRDLKRFVNMLEFYLNGFADDININDCFLILALQLFEYKLYLALKSKKQYLTTKGDEDNSRDYDAFYNHLEKTLENISREAMESLIEKLFPIVKYRKLSSESLKGNFDYWNKKHKIVSIHHFNKYFTLSLEKLEVNVNTIEELINLNSADRINSIINPYNDEQYNKSLLTQLNLLADKIDYQNSLLFVDVFLKNDNGLTLNVTLRHLINEILGKLLKKMNQSRCYGLLKEYVDLNNNLFTISDYIYHFYHKRKELIIGVDELIVNEIQLLSLKSSMARKIKEYADNNKLFNYPNLPTILTYWKEFSSTLAVKSWVSRNTEDNHDLLAFLKKYKSHEEITLEYMGEHQKSKKVFDFSRLSKDCFDDLDDVNGRVENISEDNNISEEDKKFCEEFINQYKLFKLNSEEYNNSEIN